MNLISKRRYANSAATLFARLLLFRFSLIIILNIRVSCIRAPCTRVGSGVYDALPYTRVRNGVYDVLPYTHVRSEVCNVLPCTRDARMEVYVCIRGAVDDVAAVAEEYNALAEVAVAAVVEEEHILAAVVVEERSVFLVDDIPHNVFLAGNTWAEAAVEEVVERNAFPEGSVPRDVFLVHGALRVRRTD